MAERNTLVGWAPDVGEPTTFVLLRHGVTPLTAEKRFSGDGGTDPSLTDEGRAQVAQAADLLASAQQLGTLGRHAPFTSVDAIIASPLVRTRETAEIVAERLGLPVELEPAVRECGFGDWDGLTFAEVEKDWPDHLGEWLASPTCCPPNGESFDAVYERVTSVREAITERFRGKTVVVATHVTPIKSFVRDVLEAPSSAVFRMELAPASLTVVQWFADGVGSLRAFNHTSHLVD